MTAITSSWAHDWEPFAEILRWIDHRGSVELPDLPNPRWRAWMVEHWAVLPSCFVIPYLGMMTADPSGLVRRAVAGHPATGPFLSVLADDEDAVVREMVAGNPAAGPLIANMIADPCVYVRMAIASRTDVGPYLEVLSRDADDSVRRVVALNLDAGPLLARLALDPSAIVREGVAKNLHVPERLLRPMLLDPVVYVSTAARLQLEERLLASTQKGTP